MIEKRQFPRISANFPIRINSEFLGQTIDINETGLSFVLKKPLLLSRAQAKIELSPDESLATEFNVIWNKQLVSKGAFTYGVCFIRLKEKDLDVLRKIIAKSTVLDERFVAVTQQFNNYLRNIQAEFEKFDIKNLTEKSRIQFVESEKGEIFRKLDYYFTKSWKIIMNFGNESYKLHQRYYQKNLDEILINPVEINRYIRQKPLGYPGDFITMNYIYDYHEAGYLGTSSFEKMINNYTCNIPISYSNIVRKIFFKEKILDTINNDKDAKIASVGCGSARELIEVLLESNIKNHVKFLCVDFEKKALEYVREQVKKIDGDKAKSVSIEYSHKNILDLAKSKKLEAQFKDQNLIYASGIFDYLSDRFCKRLLKQLYDLLPRGGTLIICNASAENHSHRAYYEILGDWKMIHRTREELLSWTKEISSAAEIKFEQPHNFVNYLFLSITKND